MESLNSLMVKFLKVLSDPVRLEIIEYLRDNPRSASEIQKNLNLSQSYTSHQLKKLVDGDILVYERIGKTKTFQIKDKGIYKLLSIIKTYILHFEKNKMQKIQSLEDSESLINFEDIF